MSGGFYGANGFFIGILLQWRETGIMFRSRFESNRQVGGEAFNCDGDVSAPQFLISYRPPDEKF